MLKRGVAELDPQVATRPGRRLHRLRRLRAELARSARSRWSRATAARWPRSTPPAARAAARCAPVCAEDAIDLQGYTDAQIHAMIDGLLAVVA